MPMISLIVVSASSYVKSDGHGHHGHRQNGYRPYYAYERDSTGHAPEPSYGAPAPSYGAPTPSYDAPAPSYDAPAPSYDTPSTGYDTPSTGYDTPSTGYGTEPSGYGDDDGLPDLTPFLILGIAILGLSLLFPTAVHIQNVGPITGTGTGTGGILGMGRKRRYVDEDQTSRSVLVGRSIEIYSHLNAALKPLDKKCVEKITCEVGSLASDAGLTQNSEGSISNIVFRLAGGFIPNKYNAYYNHFVYGDNCEQIKCREF